MTRPALRTVLVDSCYLAVAGVDDESAANDVAVPTGDFEPSSTSVGSGAERQHCQS